MEQRGTRNGKPIPTSKDVAALAGVAQSTVSYVMSGRRSVAPETRRKVEEAMRMLSYHPNAGARALRGARTNVIALVVHLGADADLTDSMPYIDTVIAEARRRDFEVLLSTTDEGPAGIERLAGRRVADAFVLMDVRTEDARLAVASALEQPVVLFGRPDERHGLDAVDFDTRRAAELLVDELADTGHRHVVLVGEAPSADVDQMQFLREFHDGARQRAGERGLGFDLLPRRREGWAGMEDIAEPLFAHRDDRLGVVARTSQVAEWLLQLARIEGVRIGTDVSLVGFTTDVNAAAYDPSITNVSPQPRDLSRLAMSVLFDRIDGVERASGLSLLGPDPVTRRASTVVWE